MYLHVKNYQSAIMWRELYATGFPCAPCVNTFVYGINQETVLSLSRGVTLQFDLANFDCIRLPRQFRMCCKQRFMLI